MNIVNDSITISFRDIAVDRDELKGIIANSDLDVYIIRHDYSTIDVAMETMGYQYDWANLVTAVDELAIDPYYKMISEEVYHEQK